MSYYNPYETNSNHVSTEADISRYADNVADWGPFTVVADPPDAGTALPKDDLTMNDREFITSIRDQCNIQLGTVVVPPGPVAPPYVPPTTPPDPNGVPPVTTKPSPFADCGTYNVNPAQIQVAPNQVVGVDFEVVATSYSRNLQWFGAPGQFFTASSWAIFDSGGGKVAGADNIPYGKVQDTYNLGLLGAGRYTFAVAVNGAGNLAIQWQQSPIS